MIHHGSSREWAEEIIGNLKRIREAAKPLQIAPAPGAGAAQAILNNKLDPQSVAHALAEYMKNDNSVSQAIAIRAANLQQKYPQRAF